MVNYIGTSMLHRYIWIRSNLYGLKKKVIFFMYASYQYHNILMQILAVTCHIGGGGGGVA
jgi:hypothetical protein